MSNQTRYNQMLFLTTLSVYMGLVLMGGASPALAQAALAKSFDLKVEQEFKDDLDKKPDEADDLKGLSQDLEDYLIESRGLIEALRKLHRSGDFDLAKDTFNYLAFREFPCNTDLRNVDRSEFGYHPDLPKSIEKDAGSVIGTALHLGRFAECGTSSLDKDKKASSISISVSYDRSKLFIGTGFKIKKSLGQAAGVTEKLFVAFQNFQAKETVPAGKVLAKNTEITSDNEYISIVTNLPRAGLDELLAAK